MMCRFADQGYDVIGFDGPGQRATRRRHGVAFDICWEKPTKAVLDFFHIDDVTIIGLSMGGWLATALFYSAASPLCQWSMAVLS